MSGLIHTVSVVGLFAGVFGLASFLNWLLELAFHLTARPPAPAVFIGMQAMLDGEPAQPLFNLTEAIPGHSARSTVSGATLEAAGYRLPELLSVSQLSHE